MLLPLGWTAVKEYRIYILDDDGHIDAPSINVRCLTDDEALSAARKYLHEHVVEVWCGSRRVGRLEPRK